MKNNVNDLNDHLFVQLERLTDEDVCKDEQTTRTEIQKASAVSNIAKTMCAITLSRIAQVQRRRIKELKKQGGNQ